MKKRFAFFCNTLREDQSDFAFMEEIRKFSRGFTMVIYEKICVNINNYSWLKNNTTQ